MVYNPSTETYSMILTHTQHLCTLKDQIEVLPVIDATDQMRDHVEFLCETSPQLTAREVAVKVFDEAEAKYNG
jgi:hypothetical protein